MTLLVLGLVRRVRGAALTGAIVGAGGLAAMLVEPRLASWLIPGATGATVEAPSGEVGFVAGRVLGLVVTWLLPSYGSVDLGDALLAGAVLAAVAGALVVRRRPEDEQGVMLLAALGAGAAVARLALDPEVVPGLLVAFPFLAVGAALLRRSSLTDTDAAVLVGTTVLFSGAVLATQYPTGGSGEWGGRYFALGLPAAVPVALLAIRDAGSRLGTPARRASVAGLAVGTAAISLSGIVALRQSHSDTDRVIAATVRTAELAGGSGAGEGPVVLTTEEALPRLAWNDQDGARWLYTGADELGPMLARLRGQGVSELTFVTRHEERDLVVVDQDYEVVSDTEPVGDSPWVVTQLRQP